MAYRKVKVTRDSTPQNELQYHYAAFPLRNKLLVRYNIEMNTFEPVGYIVQVYMGYVKYYA